MHFENNPSSRVAGWFGLAAEKKIEEMQKSRLETKPSGRTGRKEYRQ